MLQVLEHQKKPVNTAVLGDHHLPKGILSLSFFDFVRLSRKLSSEGKMRVFHARRNDEMIQALIAKKVFGAKIKIAFTSTAQRHHSKLTRWLMGKMDSIITTCSATNSYLKQPANIIIPHGIDIIRYAPAENRTHSWSKLNYTGTRGIAIFGRVRPSKGTDHFVEAAIQLLQKDKETTAIICGETTQKHLPFQHALENKVKKAGLSDRILFIGKQPFDKLPELFQAMSVVVAASINEGFGLTVLEALASGTPVVATEAGAWKDIIENGVQGYCVATNSCSSLHDGIKKVLSQNIESMGSAARLHVEQHYSSKQEAQVLTDHLLSLR